MEIYSLLDLSADRRESIELSAGARGNFSRRRRRRKWLSEEEVFGN